jgi:4-amino-4-deoxychorismate lyase
LAALSVPPRARLRRAVIAQQVPIKTIEEFFMSGRPPVLNAQQVLEGLQALRERQKVGFSAFFSSQLGGVVTDPALMVLPFDDHMVHRGHGIFDTAGIVNGRIYDLESHLDRFLRSAESSRLELWGSREQMRETIIQTTAVSAVRDGSIRYWLSSGTGNLGLSPAPGAEPGFFVMIFGGLVYPDRFYNEGMKVMTTTYPIKPSLYANTKSTNYLPNTLMEMEAKEHGLDNGVFVDANGNVGEASNMNCAFVTKEGVLRHPQFDHILTGCTIARLLKLAERLVQDGVIKSIHVADISSDEAKACAEMMLIGSGISVAPIVEWDGEKIGDGKPGKVSAALGALLKEDMRGGNDVMTDVPY